MSPQEQEILDFIESHKQPVAEALTQLIKDNRFVLVGESHLDESEPVRREIAIALAKLQQKGLTHVALEADSANQGIIDDLDFSDPRIKEILKEKRVAGVGWGDGNFDVLITAKRLGLKVILIDYDDGRPDSKRDNPQWQNLRDSRMIETINDRTGEESRVLIFIGNDHIHKKPIWDAHGYSYERAGAKKGERVERLGSRLAREYGADQVVAIRYIHNSGRFDGLFSDNYYFYRQQPHDPLFDRPEEMKAVLPKGVSPENVSGGKQEVVVIPDQGPVKGDERVSAADYIITVI